MAGYHTPDPPGLPPAPHHPTPPGSRSHLHTGPKLTPGWLSQPECLEYSTWVPKAKPLPLQVSMSQTDLPLTLWYTPVTLGRGAVLVRLLQGATRGRWASTPVSYVPGGTYEQTDRLGSAFTTQDGTFRLHKGQVTQEC